MKNIRELSYSELEEFLLNNGEKKFRVKQLWSWLWEKGIDGFEQMQNIPKTLIDKLLLDFTIEKLEAVYISESSDKTIKVAFKSKDEIFEGVLIPSSERVTACISTQIGCKLNCDFCATAKLGFKRNLEAYEIFMQIIELNKIAEDKLGKRIGNVVIMGMGEPLDNYDSTMLAIERLTDSSYFGMSPTRITLSTAGLVEGIKKLANDGFKANLAISLHTANPDKRSAIMPVNKSNSLDDLRNAISYFSKETGKRVTIEYLMLKGENDSLLDAKLLAEFCKAFPTKINIIEFNKVDGIPYAPSEKKDIDNFVNYLEKKNIVVNVRRSRGKDIDAACGQLANKKIC